MAWDSARLSRYALSLGLLGLAVLVMILVLNIFLSGRFVEAKMAFRKEGIVTSDYKLSQSIDAVMPWVWAFGALLPASGGVVLGVRALFRRTQQIYAALFGLGTGLLVIAITAGLFYLAAYGGV